MILTLRDEFCNSFEDLKKTVLVPHSSPRFTDDFHVVPENF